MSQTVFERKEVKYAPTKEKAEHFINTISDKIVPGDFHESTIRSIYYDTPSLDVVARSVEKPLYKEKLRTRDYGTGTVFVELKKKFKGIVYKRRLEMTANAAQKWLSGEDFETVWEPYRNVVEPSPHDIQVAREVEAFCRRYDNNLAPAFAVTAHRRSYAGVEDDLRITVDWKVDVEDFIDGTEYPLTDRNIMEIKVPGSYPLWLASALADQEIYPQSFTKVGTAYEKHIAAHRKVE